VDIGNFTEDFRIDAVKQVTERGIQLPVFQILDNWRLGVSTHSLHAWMKQQSGLPGAVVKEDQSTEIRRLKQELARVTEECDILKEAAVGSTGQHNDCFQPISWREEAKRFAWPGI
jgi:transposase